MVCELESGEEAVPLHSAPVRTPLSGLWTVDYGHCFSIRTPLIIHSALRLESVANSLRFDMGFGDFSEKNLPNGLKRHVFPT